MKTENDLECNELNESGISIDGLLYEQLNGEDRAGEALAKMVAVSNG